MGFIRPVTARLFLQPLIISTSSSATVSSSTCTSAT